MRRRTSSSTGSTARPNGLIALTRRAEGPIAQAITADHPALAQARCEPLAHLFGDRLYVELQRHGLDSERRCEHALIDMAYAKGLPLVATNELDVFRLGRRLRGPRPLNCASPAPAGGGHRSLPVDADHRFKTRAEMGGAVRRSAGGAGLDGGDRAALRLPPHHAQPILPRFTVAGSATPTDAAADEAAELRRRPRRGWRAALLPTGSRRASPRRNTAPVSPSRSTSSSE